MTDTDINVAFSDVLGRLRKLESNVNQGAGASQPGNYTSGAVLFADTNGNISQDVGSLFWDTTTRQLSIIGAQPDVGVQWTDTTQFGRLLFYQNATLFGAVQQIGSTFATTTRRGNLEVVNTTGSGGSVTFWTNSLSRMEVNFDGEVGIPAAVASVKLDVDGISRVRAAGATRYRSDWSVSGAGTTTINSFDDTGGVYMPMNINQSSVSFFAQDATTTTAPNLFSIYHRTTGTPGTNFGIGIPIFLNTNGATDRQAAYIVVHWYNASSTDASRTARVNFYAYDAAGARLFMTGEASGAAPKIGFLGTAAAVQQTGGALTAGAAYGANEQTMLNRAFGAMRTFGLLS